MKTVTIMRHAKASKGYEAQLSDFERPLNERGLRQAREAAAHLPSRLKPPVDALLLSPARRTRETAQALFETLKLPESMWISDGDLYLGEPSEWMARLAGLPQEVQHVLAVGHNPGLSELAGRLSKREVALRTAEMVQLAFEQATDWEQVGRQPGRLIMQYRPEA